MQETQETQAGSIPGLKRSSGVGNSNPFQYSCLENFMDRETWQVTVHGAAKNQKWLRYWALHIYVKQGMCVWACSVLSHFATPLTVAHQAPLSMEFSRQENFLGILLEWVAISCSRVFSQPRDGTHVSCVSCIGRGILYHCSTWEARHSMNSISGSKT